MQSSLFFAFALFALLSVSSASTASPSSTASLSSATATYSSAAATSQYSGPKLSSSSPVWSTSVPIATSAPFPTGSFAIAIQITIDNPPAPNTTLNQSSPLVQNLTTDLTNVVASQSDLATSDIKVVITNINGAQVNQSSTSRRLLSAQNASLAFVLEPAAGVTVNTQAAATTFANAVAAGNLVLPNSGVTIPAQTVPTIINVGYNPPSSSTGQGSTGGAASQASAVLSVVALAASLALLL